MKVNTVFYNHNDDHYAIRQNTGSNIMRLYINGKYIKRKGTQENRYITFKLFPEFTSNIPRWIKTASFIK